VLAVLAERPAHPFAVARLLAKNSELGQLLTVRRPLVYRAAERLAAAALCRPDHTEPGEGGPERTIYRATPAGAAPWPPGSASRCPGSATCGPNSC